MSTDVLFLDQDGLLALGVLNYKEAISEVERGLVEHTKKTMTSSKQSITIDEKLDWKFNSLISVDDKYGSIKWLGANANNREEGLPRSTSLLILNDKRTGLPLCAMDGTLISAVRTGAYCAVGAKYLGIEAPEKVGLVGSSVISKASLLCLNEQLGSTLREVIVYSRTRRNRLAFAEEMSKVTGLDVKPVESPKDACAGSHVLISATTAFAPIIKERWVPSGCLHVHFGGWEDEYDLALKVDKIICDDWLHVKERNAQTIAYMYHKNLLSDDDIYGDIGEIILGQKPGRESEEERIYFNAVGLGELDHLIGRRLYKRALKEHKGTRMRLRGAPHWLLRPY